jgi:hypothetical protein
MKRFVQWLLQPLFINQEIIMTQFADLQTKINDIHSAISTQGQAVQTGFATLAAQVKALQDAAGSGAVISQEQVDALGASLDEVKGEIVSTFTPPAA